MATGALKRGGKVDMVTFFWAVVLGFAVSRLRTLGKLHRGCERRTGDAIKESSFYMRFRAGCRDRLLLDATVIRLHDSLEKSYRATREPACQKRPSRPRRSVLSHGLARADGAKSGGRR